MNPEYRTDLHLVSWNRPKMTELVIRTIHKNTNPDNFRLVVLDNHSDPETQALLDRLHNAGMIDELHIFNNNMGLEKARDFALHYCAKSDYFVCVDNDCLPPPHKVDGSDWLDELKKLMVDNPEYGAMSLRTQVMIGTGNIFEEADELGWDLVDFPHPGGSFRIMSTDLIKQLGGWDRGAEGRGQEERYIGEKINDAGFKTAFTAKLQTLHLFGTRSGHETDRWGYHKDMLPEQTGHSDIAHPALTNGDDYNEVLKYASESETRRYFEPNGNNS